MADFEWDSDKDAANQDKHGVSFAEAQFAFADPKRVIAKALSTAVPKSASIASAWSKVVCSPFASLTATRSFALSAPDIGARARLFMSNKIKYTNEPIGSVEIVPDFLPAPADLAFREEDIKITLSLSKKSVDFFKSEASRYDAQYQRMIRRLLDAYVESREALTSGSSRRPRLRRARGS